MRPVLHGDVSSMARMLLQVAPSARQTLCARVFCEADWAEAHVRLSGRLHPLWGNGSLMSAARKRVLADEPGFDDIDYCRCFELVLRLLITHQITHQITQRRS